MTLLSGRNGIYLLLATLALAGLFAFGWVTLAGAQGENSDTEEMDASGSRHRLRCVPTAGLPASG